MPNTEFIFTYYIVYATTTYIRLSFPFFLSHSVNQLPAWDFGGALTDAYAVAASIFQTRPCPTATSTAAPWRRNTRSWWRQVYNRQIIRIRGTNHCYRNRRTYIELLMSHRRHKRIMCWIGQGPRARLEGDKQKKGDRFPENDDKINGKEMNNSQFYCHVLPFWHCCAHSSRFYAKILSMDA